ncbi:hypothetical protein PISMIDRAFT_18298 [Pisolithus microcarpus 441]|uniref:Tf2-1-like SH3-like domain-containing protein n=1 Tax=Pisolithus microcarpus 441 TaxID=765257 RepID=A0A0C9YGH4_9AGAM|nr:hypothetical protein PISMIDRAFT_18298 [Pisolithus microcarpus 441]
MLRCCIGPNQRDWVSRLPEIKFAINSATSESTGYTPFFLNTGRMPRRMIWDAPEREEYPSIRAFANKMKMTIMDAHDMIMKTRVKQTVGANKKHQECLLVKGDLVYISMKNINLPKGMSRKFVPKFVGPYQILEDFGNNSYRVELPDNLKQRGIHNVFHSSLLRIHVPNDDQKFPGRQDDQILELGGSGREWAVDWILRHHGSHSDAMFEVLWVAGDKTWLPYDEVAHLKALADYFEVIGIDGIGNLKDVGDGGFSDNDPQPINIAHVRTNLKPNTTKLASHIHLIDNPPLLIVTRAAPDVHEIDLHLLVPLVEHCRLAATSDLDPMLMNHSPHRHHHRSGVHRPELTPPSSSSQAQNLTQALDYSGLEAVKLALSEIVTELTHLALTNPHMPNHSASRYMAEPDPRRNIKRVSFDFFSVCTATSNRGQGKHKLIHHEQVQSYFTYDLALQQNSGNPPEVPTGYHLFREAYRRDARTRSRFAFCEPNSSGHPRIVFSRTLPTKEEVLGADCNLRSREEIEGGKVLTGPQADTIDSMLWDAAERLKRQRERNHQGYLNRRERREDRQSQPESLKAAGKRPAAPPPLRIHSNPPSTASPNQPVTGPSRIATDDTLSTTIVTTNDDEDGVYEEYYREELADESMNAEVPMVDEGVA